ncbi:MAG: RNA 2',3'-cyclic phosphodiesterase [Bacteroidota bacterium]
MEKQYYRTFIGIPIRPGPELLSLRSELMASFSRERISWVQPELFHVTLRFIGDTPVSALENIRELLRKRVQVPKTAELELEGVGSFGPRKKPRVIWVGFKEPDLFETVKGEVDRALETCGIQREDFPFSPHLTLGRVRSLKYPDVYYESIRNISPSLKETVQIDRMVYYRSELGREGPKYTGLEEYMFSK